jgi:maltooligosyltrehalose trehalohydrolase
MRNAETVSSPRKENLGVQLLGEDECSFLVWAPHANRVDVCIGEPQERAIPMQAVGSGYFHIVAKGISSGAFYRYRLNNEKERPDPASRYQPRGVHGPSQVVDGQFRWNDSRWAGLPLEKYVLYELHV